MVSETRWWLCRAEKSTRHRAKLKDKRGIELGLWLFHAKLPNPQKWPSPILLEKIGLVVTVWIVISQKYFSHKKNNFGYASAFWSFRKQTLVGGKFLKSSVKLSTITNLILEYSIGVVLSCDVIGEQIYEVFMFNWLCKKARNCAFSDIFAQKLLTFQPQYFFNIFSRYYSLC